MLTRRPTIWSSGGVESWLQRYDTRAKSSWRTRSFRGRFSSFSFKASSFDGLALRIVLLQLFVLFACQVTCT